MTLLDLSPSRGRQIVLGQHEPINAIGLGLHTGLDVRNVASCAQVVLVPATPAVEQRPKTFSKFFA